MADYGWKDILHNWSIAQNVLNVRLEGAFDFQEIHPDRVPPALADFGVDWWPKHLIQQKLDDMKTDSQYIARCDTPKGTLRTAELLKENSIDWERQSAVYIKASLWEKQESHDPAWRGAAYDLINSLYRAIRNHFPDLGGWHHSVKHTLPVSATPAYCDRDSGIDTNFRELMHLLVLEAAATKGTWQLINLPANWGHPVPAEPSRY